ncbi:GNAT family N-acetyltransferase [Streptococcus himalayensis]|uniref:GNAT family acetyltransferase n=1 Tax=Streptococcus himalayensis TaxID=1888195 RepID=A0A917EGL8_9STRE|nr:GNAT family N-acetyltransferase [Streptococcus himalayensis]GGE31849.1 GNAT family acetyltransferase [Streptococcus himalayensis]
MIRPAQERDGKAICLLNADSLGYDFPLEATQKRLRDLLLREEHIILVCEEEGEVVGYAHATAYDCLYVEPLLNLLALAVKKEARGKGHARALIEGIKTIGKKAGYHGLRINSGIMREGAHECYRRLGCEEKADQKRFFLRWERADED